MTEIRYEESKINDDRLELLLKLVNDIISNANTDIDGLIKVRVWSCRVKAYPDPMRAGEMDREIEMDITFLMDVHYYEFIKKLDKLDKVKQ